MPRVAVLTNIIVNNPITSPPTTLSGSITPIQITKDNLFSPIPIVKGGTHSSPNIVNQVAGLVPLLPCCSNIDSYATFYFVSHNKSEICNSSLTYRIQIKINGVYYGIVIYTEGTDTAATLTASINTALTGSGFTASNVNLTFWFGGHIVTGQINSPTGSGALYNGYSLYFDTAAVCLGTIYNYFEYGISQNGCSPCNYVGGLNGYIDDNNYVLPVFGSLTCSDADKNDFNTFIVSIPKFISFTGLTLQKLNGNTWSNVATLDNTNTYGTFILYQYTNLNYAGYTISWKYVLALLGEGCYRVYYNSNTPERAVCGYSITFKLQAFTPELADLTVKFSVTYYGGNIGSVTTQGQYWSLTGIDTSANKYPLTITDSIRFLGMFGYESAGITTTEVKYYSGFLQQVRNEAIKSFILNTGLLPFWLVQRFYSYCLMADTITVNDNNIANSNQNMKNQLVRVDGKVTPKYNMGTHLLSIKELQFKEQTQFVFRDLAN